MRLDLRPVGDRNSALAAIDDIIEDGEGAPAGRDTSHYGRFSAIRRAYAEAEYFEAARPVVRNPQTREHRGTAGPGALLTHELSMAVAELFNEVYAAALRVLQQFFAFDGETSEQREALKAAAGHLMSTGIRPIAEVLTDLPAYADGSQDRAGPPFELYDAVSVSPFLPARWTVLLERLEACSAAALDLGAEVPRLGRVGETLSFIRRNLAGVAP